MIAAYIAAFILIVGLGLTFYSRFLARKPRLAVCEYWVYVRAEKLPKTEALMTRMISENPFNKPRKPVIGAREGMLFSDIRLNLGVALRSKNPHVFRPDLFETHIEPSPAVLSRLGDARAMAQARYISDVELKDDRHLQFMPHCAAALADLMEGNVVFDPVLERLFTIEEFRALLDSDPNAARQEVHLRVVWVPLEQGGKAMSRGLRKMGLTEIETKPVPTDQRVLAEHLVLEACRKILADRAVPASLQLLHFGDTFIMEFEERPKGQTVATLKRLHPL